MTALFIHGAGCTPDVFEFQREDFPDGVYVRLPGRDGPEKGPNTIAAFADFIGEFVAQSGLSDVVLCGHSMGGAIALEQVLRKPAWLRAACLLDSGARLRVSATLLQQLRDDFEGAVTMLAGTYFFSRPKPEWVNRALEDLRAVGREQTLRDFEACEQFDVLDRLPEVTVPLLALTGENDTMTPPKYARAFSDRVPTAQARIIPGAGHFTMVERPQETNAALRAFISAVA